MADSRITALPALSGAITSGYRFVVDNGTDASASQVTPAQVQALADVTSLERFGGVGDGTTDCLTAFQAAAAALNVGGSLAGRALVLAEGKTYYTSAPVAFDGSYSIIGGGVVKVGGLAATRQVGVTVGVQSGYDYLPCPPAFDFGVVRQAQSTWDVSTVDSDGLIDTGVLFYTLYGSRIVVRQARGFTVGAAFIGWSDGFQQCHVSLGKIHNNKYGIRIGGRAAAGWCNDNIFEGGDFWLQSSVNTSLDRYGVWAHDWYDCTLDIDKNLFIKPCFQLAKPAAQEAIPILAARLSNTIVLHPRNEGNSTTFLRLTVAPAETTAASNRVEGLWVDPTTTPLIDDQTASPGTSLRPLPHVDIPGAWHVVDGIAHRLLGSGSNALTIAGAAWCDNSGAVKNGRKSGTSNNVVVTRRGVRGKTVWAGPSLRIRTTRKKRFFLRRTSGLNPADLATEDYPGVVCWDASGTQLVGTAPYHATLTGGTSYTAGQLGGYYHTLSDVLHVDYPVLLQVGASVEYADVFFSAGILSGFAIMTEDGNPPEIMTEWAFDNRRYATAAPDQGYILQGEVYHNLSTVSGNTTPLGWVGTTTGWKARAWVASTAYDLWDLVSSGGNIYEATTAGTASTVAPSGTTTFTDGSVVWTYVGAQGAVAALANVP